MQEEEDGYDEDDDEDDDGTLFQLPLLTWQPQPMLQGLQWPLAHQRWPSVSVGKEEGN